MDVGRSRRRRESLAGLQHGSLRTPPRHNGLDVLRARIARSSARYDGGRANKDVRRHGRQAQPCSLALDDRGVLLLRDVEGLSGEETARSVELTVAAMKSRLHRARLRLLAALRESEGHLMAQDRKVGALRCSVVLALLGKYVDGDLPAGDVAEVELHLRRCTVCERFGGRFSRVVRSVRATLGAAPAADEEVLARVRAALGR